MAEKDSFMVPTSSENAAMQFFVEAMRQNTETLKGMQAESKEILRKVNDIGIAVVKIEAQNVPEKLKDLDTRTEALEKDRNNREGASKALGIAWKNLPSVAALAVAIVLLVFMFLRSQGRI